MAAAATLALALVVGGVPTGYVIDNAGLLNPMTVQELDAVLYQHEVETSNQVVVETINSLGGEVLEDYSLRRAMALGIGQKGHDNGVYVLISRDDRKMRIEVGYGLEGALPDVVCQRIIREQMTPRFREGSYDEGVTAGVNTILAAIRGEYTAGPLDRLYAVVPLDRISLPQAPQAVQIVVGTFYWLFSVAWAFAGPVLFRVGKLPIRLGLLPGIAISGLLVWAYPWAIVPLGFLALIGIVNTFAPDAGRTYSGSGSSGGGWSSSGSSGSSYSSSSSSGSSFSGGGGSFGGGGSSGSW